MKDLGFSPKYWGLGFRVYSLGVPCEKATMEDSKSIEEPPRKGSSICRISSMWRRTENARGCCSRLKVLGWVLISGILVTTPAMRGPKWSGYGSGMGYYSCIRILS